MRAVACSVPSRRAREWSGSSEYLRSDAKADDKVDDKDDDSDDDKDDSDDADDDTPEDGAVTADVQVTGERGRLGDTPRASGSKVESVEHTQYIGTWGNFPKFVSVLFL